MRVHIKSEKFPSMQVILAYLKNSKNVDSYKSFLIIYYGTLQIIAGMMGFESIRISLEEVQLIMQHHRINNIWIFDFKKF